jgi:hypothetical protein
MLGKADLSGVQRYRTGDKPGFFRTELIYVAACLPL